MYEDVSYMRYKWICNYSNIYLMPEDHSVVGAPWDIAIDASSLETSCLFDISNRP